MGGRSAALTIPHVPVSSVLMVELVYMVVKKPVLCYGELSMMIELRGE
jgi:hypothetical protein